MEPQTPDQAEPELDALLRRARPTPAGAWVHATGEALFAGDRGGGSRRAPLRLGAVFAAGLAALALVLSLAGVGPLGNGDRAAVQADDTCRTVTVTRTERVPVLIPRADGSTDLVYTRKPVRRSERRC